MKYRIYICICAVIIVSAVAVYAIKVYEISFNNHIRTGSVDIIIEQFEQCDEGERLIEPGVVMPNQDVSYIPKVTNLRADGYVRVKVELEMDERIPRPLKLEDVYEVNEDWIQKGNYFYNTKVMKKGDTSVLFRGFHVPEEWTKDTASGFNFTVTADIIQDNNFIPDFNSIAPWGSIEIEHAKEEDNIVYGIASRRTELQEFEYTSYSGIVSESTDLFSNFRCFLAGDTYSDTLIMKNKSDSDIKVFFRTQTESDDMLKKMKLKIKCDGKKVYEGDLAAEALNDFKKLTVINSNKENVLDFEVELPEDSENYYSVLKDNVVWQFKVEEIKNDGEISTGDRANLLMVVFVLILSGVLILRAITWKRK